MNLVMKTWKKGIGFFLALACIIALLPAQTAHAAPATNPLTLRVEQKFMLPAGSSANEQVSYALTAKNSGNPMPTGSNNGVYVFTINGTDDISLPAISFPGYGIYEYELRQTTAAALGYTYDSEVYTITVYYEATYMEMITTNSAGKKVTELEFLHAYAPLPTDPKLMTYPPVKLTVQGNPGKADTFTFVLTEKGATGVRTLAAQGKTAPGVQTMEARGVSNGFAVQTLGAPVAAQGRANLPSVQTLANPMPDGSVNGAKTVNITGSGEASFGEWNYDKAGTYYYKVTQVDTKLKGYTYDLSVYTITDTVKDINGQLVLDRVVTNSAGKAVQTCIYINQYEKPLVGGKDPGNGNGTYNGNGSKGSIGPKTGDDVNLFALIMKLTLSCLAVIGCALYLLFHRTSKRAGKNTAQEYNW